MKLLFLSIIALALCHFSLLGQTKKDAFSKTKDAVVKVISSDLPELGFNSNYGSGTGYIVSKDGYIITNHHVIDEAVAISVIITKGNNVDTSRI
jgi:serine protease Do